MTASKRLWTPSLPRGRRKICCRSFPPIFFFLPYYFCILLYLNVSFPFFPSFKYWAHKHKFSARESENATKLMNNTWLNLSFRPPHRSSDLRRKLRRLSKTRQLSGHRAKPWWQVRLDCFQSLLIVCTVSNKHIPIFHTCEYFLVYMHIFKFIACRGLSLRSLCGVCSYALFERERPHVIVS